jgi:tetratricopeptide (TPR) repeat protein
LLAGRLALASYESDVGQRLLKAGRYEEAVERFTAAVRWHPLQAAYYSRLGFAYEHLANQTRRRDLLVDAEASFRAATAISPYDYHHFWNLGRLYHNYEKFSSDFNAFDPLNAYRRAVELHPTHTALRRELDALTTVHPSGPNGPKRLEKATRFSLTDRAHLLSLAIARS